MWIEALVFIETPETDEQRRQSFEAAMGRRGWERSGTDSFRLGFTDVSSDERIVQIIERDVKQAAYVAGIAEFDAACLLSDGALSTSIAEHLGKPQGGAAGLLEE